VALAYVRARQGDPLASFGDFVAVSDCVDDSLAEILKGEVSDGVIAPAYTQGALKTLKEKKGGKYVVLKGDVEGFRGGVEYREVGGVVLSQRRNDVVISEEQLKNIVTEKKDIPPSAMRDLLVATITLKYTQSNAVVFALRGQTVGVGAGHQSRVDCVKSAARKVEGWWLRRHPAVRSLRFKEFVKRQAKVNARVRFVEGDMSEAERALWLSSFVAEPQELSASDKRGYMAQLSV
jgi:phosphoribosylaminoimidazolecarboxamide formyltransferase / IMP cyclohydrolase